MVRSRGSQKGITEDQAKVKRIETLISTLGEGRFLKDRNLADLTYTKLDVQAEYLIIVGTVNELVEVLNLAYELKLKVTLVGNGTKIFIPNEKIKGLVVKNNCQQIKILGIKGAMDQVGLDLEHAFLEIDSGVRLGQINNFLYYQKLKPLEFNTFPQGTLGGSLFIDEILKQQASQIKIWYRGKVLIVQPDLLQRNHIILSAIFKVTPNDDRY